MTIWEKGQDQKVPKNFKFLAGPFGDDSQPFNQFGSTIFFLNLPFIYSGLSTCAHGPQPSNWIWFRCLFSYTLHLMYIGAQKILNY